MDLLAQFGIEQFPLLLHMAIFTVAIVFLSTFVFKPYLHAFELREQKTKGGEALAGEIQKESLDLKLKYETRAKELSSEIKNIFDAQRQQAQKEQEVIVQQAREAAQKQLDQVRAVIGDELGVAEKQIKEEAPVVAKVLVAKLLSAK